MLKICDLCILSFAWRGWPCACTPPFCILHFTMDPHCCLRRSINYVAAQYRLQKKEARKQGQMMKDMKFFVIDAANRTAAEMKTSMLTDIEKLVKKASDDLSTSATFETDFNNLKMELDEKNTRMEKRMKMLLNEMATAHDESHTKFSRQ